MRNSDLVLFLGAGFSRAAGLPLMREFGDLSIETQPGLARHASAAPEDRQFRYAAPMLLEAQQVYEAFRRLCADTGFGNRGTWNNVEDVFCVAEAIQQAGVDQMHIAGTPHHVDDLLRAIKLWIWKTYQQLPVKRGAPKRKLDVDREPFQRLFGMLKERDVARRTTILTTNYDIVVEYFCFLNDIPCQYPVKWDPEFRAGYGSALFVNPPNEDSRGPVLCKLHGSVNFFEDTESEEAQLWIAADLGDGTDIGKSGGGAFKDEPAISAVDAVWHIREKYGAGFTPSIVAPSYAKLREKAWLTRTWKAALRALGEAREIVFIGYSLPPTDGFMRSLLASARVVGPNNHSARVTVVDPSKHTLNEYADWYPSIEPDQPLRFAEAMEDVLPGVLERVA